MNQKIKKITIIALAVALNIVGSKIALLLKLPIFLDSIGTMLSAIVIGPVAAVLTALTGGLVNGALGDIYSIYFAPSGMLMGLMAGLLFHKKKTTLPAILWKDFFVVLPGSALSSLISTIVFGGITSAFVTTTIVQVLSATWFSLFQSAFLVQLATDYVDKLVAILLVVVVVKRLPYEATHFVQDDKEVTA